MTNIFISYAREDLVAAQDVARLLEDRGWDVWWDRDLIAGQRFDEVIEQQITSAEAVIVLWSKSSVASEWVRSEASAAAERDVLVPAQIDETPVPLRFRMLHSVDLSEWAGNADDENIGRLVAAVQSLAGPPPHRSAPLPPPSPPPPPATSQSSTTPAVETVRMATDSPTSSIAEVAEVAAAPPIYPSPPAPPHRHRSRWMIAVLAVAAVAIGALVLLWPDGNDGSVDGGTSTTASPPATTATPATDAPPTTAAPATTAEPTTTDDPQPPPTPDPNVLERGSSGQDVEEVQGWLAVLGYVVDVDGVFGPQTAAAVEQFEQDQGYPVDGVLVISEREWQALRNAAQSAPAPPEVTEVPNVFGLPAADARAQLQSLGFEVDEGVACSGSVGAGEVRQVWWLDETGGKRIVVDKVDVADRSAPTGTLLTVLLGSGRPCASG